MYPSTLFADVPVYQILASGSCVLGSMHLTTLNLMGSAASQSQESLPRGLLLLMQVVLCSFKSVF